MNKRRWFSRSAVLNNSQGEDNEQEGDNGQGVIVVGGGADPTTAEIFDFGSRTWKMAASFPSIDAFGSQLSRLHGGHLLLTGGFDYELSPPDGPQLGSVKSFIYVARQPARHEKAEDIEAEART